MMIFQHFWSAAKKGTITIASAGVGSSGHQAAEIFAAYGGVEYRHVPYQGGAPANRHRQGRSRLGHAAVHGGHRDAAGQAAEGFGSYGQ